MSSSFWFKLIVYIRHVYIRQTTFTTEAQRLHRGPQRKREKKRNRFYLAL